MAPFPTTRVYSAIACLALAACASAQQGIGGTPGPAVADVLQSRSVRHTPRLQLGVLADDSPRPASDQVVLIWQTVNDVDGAGSVDGFQVEWRLEGSSDDWAPSSPITTRRANVAPCRQRNDPNELCRLPTDPIDYSRVIHEAEVTGLELDTRYEYRWQHTRGGDVLDERVRGFKTRIPVGSDKPFNFTFNGDSAGVGNEVAFNTVAALNLRLIEAGELEFSFANGDMAYNEGYHENYDRRMSPEFAPEQSEVTAQVIEFHSIGNHDNYNGAFASMDNFVAPLPRVIDPLQLLEHYYSYDWGMVHFTVIDASLAATFFNEDGMFDQPIFESMMNWIREDVLLSKANGQRWHIVAGHYPISGCPDKDPTPSELFHRRMVLLAQEIGIDVITVGHSHTYSRTWPLVPSSTPGAAWLTEDDEGVTFDRYEKGKGLVSVVAGNGGSGLRPGVWDDDDVGNVGAWVAAGFSMDTAPLLEHGVARYEVSTSELRISYQRAVDGELMDTVTIYDPVELANAETRNLNQAPKVDRCAQGCGEHATCVRAATGNRVCQCARGWKGDGVSDCELNPTRIAKVSATATLNGVRVAQVKSKRHQIKSAIAEALMHAHRGYELTADSVQLTSITPAHQGVHISYTVFTEYHDGWDVQHGLSDARVSADIAARLNTQGLPVTHVLAAESFPDETIQALASPESRYPGQPAALAVNPPAHRGASAHTPVWVYAAAGLGVAAALAAAAAVAVRHARRAKARAQENLDRVAAAQA